MLPYSGFSFISSLYSSSESFFGFKIPFLVSIKSGFSEGLNSPSTIAATLSPIAGALDKPGDSIPAQSIKYGASESSSMINSCPSSCARFPANDVMT